MAPPRPTILDLVTETRQRLAGSRLTTAQAKLYSQHTRLGLGRPGLAGFKATEADDRLEEVWLLLDAAFAERESAHFGNWRKGVRRAAELLEWLSDRGFRLGEVPTAVLSAAAYQVAAYPAMASGLLASLPETGGTERILRLFLGARFPELLLEASAELRRVESTPLESSDLEQRINRAVIVETLRCFTVLAAQMRWGDESRIEAAIEKLGKLAAVGQYSQVRHSGVTAQLCALAARQYSESMIWPYLAALGEGEPDSVRSAFDRFGRAAFASGRSLVWSSQRVGIERLASRESFVLCTPTGSGKTSVAELALVSALFNSTANNVPPAQSEPAPLGLYLVPSRALAAEIEQRLGADLRKLGSHQTKVTGLYGGTDWGPTDAWLTSDAPTVLVCTYEKAEALLRFLGPVFMQRVKCVIVDEAHFVQFGGSTDELRSGENRQLKLESLGARLLRALEGCHYRLIALSAVTAGLEGSISRWLVGDAAKPANSDYRSTRQLVGRLECFPSGESRIQYDLLDRAKLTFAEVEESPYVPSPFSKHPPSPSFVGRTPTAAMRPHLLWAALHLVSSGNDGVPRTVLISVMSRITAYEEDFLVLLEKDWAGLPLPVIPAQPKDDVNRGLWNDCLATMRDYFTEASAEYRLLKHGIAVHHGKMPALLARRLKTVIEAGIVRLVLATSTLSEGVNLPVEYILVPEVYRSGKGLMSQQEFMNLVGRAGRPGHGTEGRTLVLVPFSAPTQWLEKPIWRLVQGAKDVIASIADEIGGLRQTTPTSPLARLLETIHEEWAKLASTPSEEEFSKWLEKTEIAAPSGGGSVKPEIECLDTLDGILLAGVEELQQMNTSNLELDHVLIEDGLKRIWARSFARIASEESALLERAFLRRGGAIPIHYPDRDERRRIYKTSLPPLSARELLARLATIRTHLESGTRYADWSPAERFCFIERTVALISEVSRFTPTSKAANSKVDWRIVLRWWLDPLNCPIKPKPNQISAWHDYSAKNFSYKVNWGLGSVIALCLDQVGLGVIPVALSLEDWPKSGLPWGAFWIKDLLTWGTLEPVAAFLLARGGAVTRPDAEGKALLYYESLGEEMPSRDKLDPRTIRDWALAANGAPEPNPPPVEPRDVPIELSMQASEFRMTHLRIVPHKIEGGGVIWTDSAGYKVGSTPSGFFEEQWSAALEDFVLDVALRTVRVTRYL
ncbi:MAG: DEAD/DEAH box [Planctomycetota bacterium]|nr:MAG: DEAD/DEAH box [Planctomycetota bacterium]